MAIQASFLKETLECNHGQLQDALRSTSATILTNKKLSDAYNHQSRRLEGQPITGKIGVELGWPRGLAEAYLIRLPRHKGAMHLAPCEYDVSNSILQFNCLPCIEDLGLALITYNALTTATTLELVGNAVKETLRGQMHSWVQNTTDTTRYRFPTYMGVEYRIIPLKIGWPAVVQVGQNVRMFCPLSQASQSDGMVCRRMRSKTSKIPGATPVGFRIEKNPNEKFFYLTKKGADLEDGGIYGCSVTVRGAEIPTCTDRRLTVIPDASNIRTFIYKNITEGAEINVGDMYDQYTDESLPFTLTSQAAYIVCWVQARPDEQLVTNLTLSHTNPKTGAITSMPFDLVATRKAREGDQWVQSFSFFKFGGHGRVDYAGRINATCSIEYSDEDMKVPQWLRDPNDQNENAELEHLASARRTLLCMHAAEGSVWFEASVPQLEEHPVPLGTTVKCTGAEGYPLPVHEWHKITTGQILSPLYAKYTNLAYAPDVFTDAPGNLPSSMFQGDLLVIPNDPKFRGTSFLFVCKASNLVNGDLYSLERPLFLTVSLCEERFVSIDLALIFSPQMLAGHVLLEERSQAGGLGFFGLRYVHLLRQVILGLAHGPKYARISTNPTSVLRPYLRLHQLYKAALPFNHNQLRMQLAKLLISDRIRPRPIYASGVKPCPRKRPVDMKGAIKSVEHHKPESTNDYLSITRPHVVVLPQDRFVYGDIDAFMERLQRKNSKIIRVCFEKPSSWATGSPNHQVQLTMDGVFEEKCSSEFETDPRTFIRRLPLFDAICEEARPAETQEHRYRGVAFMSPKRSLLHAGTKWSLYVMSLLNPLDQQRYRMMICLMHDIVASKIKLGRTTQLEMDSMCQEYIGISEPSEQRDFCISFSQDLVLKKSHDGMVVVFFQRSTTNAKVPARFITMQIHILDPENTKPYLIVKQWSERARDSAEFECIIDVKMPKFAIALAYRPRRHSPSYQLVINSTSGKQGIGHKDLNRKASARLIWPEVPTDADGADIVCMVMRLPLPNNTSLTSLPPATSDPVQRHFLAFCPQKPLLSVVATSPTTGELIAPRLGIRMTFVCEAMTGTEINVPIQLAYADKAGSFVICSESGEGEVNITVPCTFSSWKDGGCSRANPDKRSYPGIASFAHCSIGHAQGRKMSFRRIEYTIPMLSYDNFRAFAFCETLPPWDIEEDTRLLSNAVDNMFQIAPTVRYLKVTEDEWACGVVSFPPPSVRTWKMTKASPWNFRLGLSSLSSREGVADYFPRVVMHGVSARGFYPLNLTKDEARNNGTCFFDLIFPAPSAWSAGLYGVATMECCVQNAPDQRSCQEGYVNRAYGKDSAEWLAPGRLLPLEGLVHPGEPWIVQCPLLTFLMVDQERNIYLLGKVKLLEQSFISVPLVHTIIAKVGEMYSVVRKVTVGLWATLTDDDIDAVVVDYDNDTVAVQFTILKALPSHSGSYACRAFFYNGFSDSDVEPELLVLRPNAPPIFAYKLEPTGWVFAKPQTTPPMLSNQQPVQTRCLIWRMQRGSSVLDEPLLARSVGLKSPYIQVAEGHIRRRQFRPVSYIDYRLLDYTFRANLRQDLGKHLGCYWYLHTAEERRLGRYHGPFRVCTPPNDLFVTPMVTSHLNKKDELTCTPSSEIFPVPSLEWLYKIGPLPRPAEYVHPSILDTAIKSRNLKLTDFAVPGFYVFTCKAKTPCNERNISSEKDAQFIVAPEGAHGFTTVRLSPRIALAGGAIHVECPSILTAGSGLTAKYLIWFRLGRSVDLTNPDEHPMAEVLSRHDLINGTVNTQHPNLIAYRSEKAGETFFAIDITPASYTDSGYYGCVVVAFKPGSNMSDMKLSQLSSHSACTALDVDAPTLVVLPTRPSLCYRVGEVVSIACESVAYQGFCGDTDKPMGLGLFSTRALLNITSEENATSYELNVVSSIMFGLTPPKKRLFYTTVQLAVTNNHNEARVTCEIRPWTKGAIISTEWSKLEDKLTKQTSIQLCVFFPPIKLIIDPPLSDEVSQTKLDFVLGVGEIISCLADGNPPPKVSLDAFPVKPGGLEAVIFKGLDGLAEWVDKTRSQPNWPIADLEGGTGAMMTVRKDEGSAEDQIYAGICTARNTINGKDETSQKLFVFRVRDASVDTMSDGWFRWFLGVAFLLAIFAFVGVTFTREFLILSRRSSRTYHQIGSSIDETIQEHEHTENLRPSLRNRRLLPPKDF